MSSLKLLVFAALMVAVTRALSMIPGIPIAHTKLTWGFLSRSLCALVCGPVMGLVFGFVEDILGFILHPTGDFFPGYTLSTMVGVLVYALCFFRRRITVVRLVAANLLVNLLVNAGLGSIGARSCGVESTGAGSSQSNMAKNMVTILPKAAVLYFLFQALLPILQRMNLIPRQVDGVIRLI
ncbi:MAG: folate family ECF transporter S component [Lawsonibacter sp.]